MSLIMRTKVRGQILNYTIFIDVKGQGQKSTSVKGH